MTTEHPFVMPQAKAEGGGEIVTLAPVVEGLTFPEGPRWHDGRLFFSDFYSNSVYATDLAGNCEKIVEVPEQPSGLGWLPNGDMLVVSMRDQTLLRWDGQRLAVHADLSPFARNCCNDMIVLSDGTAFVGNFGFDPLDEQPRPATLIRVTPGGSASIAVERLDFPNGMALLGNEQVLVVAESLGRRLTAFDIGPGGSLTGRRIVAGTGDCMPDGICADADGNLLVTTMTCKKLVRFAPDGSILASWDTGADLWAVACSDVGDILLCTSGHSHPEDCRRERSGRIQRLVVDA